MRDHAVFIPSDDGSIAAVITVPDRDPAGLVVLLSGVTAGRSHRFQLWTRAAERLAEVGLASIRIDYPGIGDSWGEMREADSLVSEGRQGARGPLPLDEIMRAVGFAMRATGVDWFAVVGNCFGAKLALLMAERSASCVGVLGVRAGLVRPGRVAGSMVKARRSRVAKVLRKTPLRFSRLVKRLTRGKRPASEGVRGTVRSAVQRGPVELLYSQEDFTFSERLRGELQRMVADLPQEVSERLVLRVEPGTGLEALQSLEVQDMLIERIEEWAIRCYPEVRTEAARAAR